jgi:hypothetical protein
LNIALRISRPQRRARVTAKHHTCHETGRCQRIGKKMLAARLKSREMRVAVSLFNLISYERTCPEFGIVRAFYETWKGINVNGNL